MVDPQPPLSGRQAGQARRDVRIFGCLPLDGQHCEGWHADNASADSMTGWEPIVVKLTSSEWMRVGK